MTDCKRTLVFCMTWSSNERKARRMAKKSIGWTNAHYNCKMQLMEKPGKIQSVYRRTLCLCGEHKVVEPIQKCDSLENIF